MTRRRGELRLHRGRMPATGDARRRWSERSGLLLRLVDDDGVEGFGEASPLPGYSPDTLDEARVELAAWIDRSVDLSGLRSPSARAAVETARIDLEARRRGLPFESVLAERTDDSLMAESLPVAGLLPFGEGDDIVLARAAELVDGGYRTLKVKVSAGDDRLDLLREIRRRGDVRLRLDANRSWPAEEVGSRLEAYASLDPPPEFVEEPTPFASPHEAAATMAGSPVPLALDETLHTLPDDGLDAWLACDAVRVVVLKPMVLGFERALEIGRRAGARGVGVVLSHAFDGPVAREAAACLARVLSDGAYAQGLGRHAGLDAWPPWRSPRLRGAEVVAGQGAGLGPLEELWERLE